MPLATLMMVPTFVIRSKALSTADLSPTFEKSEGKNNAPLPHFFIELVIIFSMLCTIITIIYCRKNTFFLRQYNDLSIVLSKEVYITPDLYITPNELPP